MTASRRPIMLVAGARPNFMKIAPLVRALRDAQRRVVLVHTGQHYDEQMSKQFIDDLALPEPDHHLAVGPGTHAVQTATIMQRFEPVLLETRPEWLVVVGDVNSTLACALVAAKLKHDCDVLIAHVEAGLRSRDWRMPEEINRVLTDRLSDVLFIPSHDAEANLLAEGIQHDAIVFAGNVMIDTLLSLLPRARSLRMFERYGLEPGRYAVATIHRPSNVDTRADLATVLEALSAVARDLPVVLPLHPRTRNAIDRFGFRDSAGSLRMIEPLGYVEMLGLMDAAALAITDSGGIQEETTVLGIPCVTLREQTERPVTVTHGTNRMAPWPITVNGVLGAVRDAVRRGRVPVGSRAPEGWDGRAAERMAQRLGAHPTSATSSTAATLEPVKTTR